MTTQEAAGAEDWASVRDQLVALSQSDDHEAIALAVQILNRVIATYSDEIGTGWANLALSVISPPLRQMRGAVNAITRLPSESAYLQLSLASAALLASLPPLHEILLLSSTERVSAVVRAADELETRIAEATEAVTRESDQFSQLLSLAADQTLASSYSVQAAAESTKADRWRAAAVTVLGLSVAFAAFTVFRTLSMDVDFADVGGRLGLSAALAAFGGYLQHQSSLHRRREGSARATELKLRTIGPFSASLPPDEAARVRTTVGLTLFGALDAQEIGESIAPPKGMSK